VEVLDWKEKRGNGREGQLDAFERVELRRRTGGEDELNAIVSSFSPALWEPETDLLEGSDVEDLVLSGLGAINGKGVSTGGRREEEGRRGGQLENFEGAKQHEEFPRALGQR